MEIQLGLYIGAKTREEAGDESRIRTKTALQVATNPVGIVRRDSWGCTTRYAKRAPSLSEERDHGVYLWIIGSGGSLRRTRPGTCSGELAGVGCVAPLEKHHCFGASRSILNFSRKVRNGLLRVATLMRVLFVPRPRDFKRVYHFSFFFCPPKCEMRRENLHNSHRDKAKLKQHKKFLLLLLCLPAKGNRDASNKIIFFLGCFPIASVIHLHTEIVPLIFFHYVFLAFFWEKTIFHITMTVIMIIIMIIIIMRKSKIQYIV